jgi:hypothetical protein
MLMLVGLTAGSAWAQNFAAPVAVVAYVADGDCGVATAPCSLRDAVIDATDGGASGTTVYSRLVQTNSTVTFEEDLVDGARIDMSITFDTYIGSGISVPSPTGIIQIDGTIIIGGSDVVTLPENVELRLIGQSAQLQLRQNAEIDGDGTLVFSANGGAHKIQLGDPSVGCPGATDKTAFLSNVVIDKIGGTVTVTDQCSTDINHAELFITNSLDVANGILDMTDNDLTIVSDDTGSAFVNIGGGAAINGDATFFISVAPAALGGFPNTLAGAFEITGAGNLNMAFDKNTDAGVIIELNQIGTGGNSYNRAGALFVTDAVTFIGNFRNEFAARTEFWELTSISSNLEVEGPGGEVFPADGTCFDRNESGVYFFTPVNVGGDVITTETDDPVTPDCVEGVWFEGDASPGTASKAADHQDESIFSGDWSSDGVVGIRLRALDFFHNLGLEGDLNFDESPIFVLESPADAYPIGDLCSAYNNESDGNKVLFLGGSDQNLLYNTLLDIQSVQVKKNSTGDDVEIDELSAAFLIDTSLEIMNGNFITNGLLDANSGTTPGEGATIVINRDANGDGVLHRGDASRAYLSDATEHTPRKVKYTGSSPHFSGDEIPGPTSGSVGGPEVFLDEIEIFQSVSNSVITVGKDFTVVSQITLTQGILDIGSSKLKIENHLLGAIGNGSVSSPEQIGARGELVFPTEHLAGFTPGDDGIDLLYFGTEDRTVGLLWPPSESTVAARKVDADVNRDVTIDPACGDDITISLRADDDAARINGDLVIGGDGPGQSLAGGSDVGALDIVGNTLEINATNGNDTVLDVHNGSDLTDSTDPFLAGASARVSEEAMAELANFKNAVRFGELGATIRPSESLLTALETVRFENMNASKAADHAGLLRFIGGDDTDVWIETSAGRLRFDFPAIEVDRGNSSHVTFDAEGVLATTIIPLPANRIDVLGTSHFNFIDADRGVDDDIVGDAGGVELLNGLDHFYIDDWYDQYDGEFLMAGVSSVGAAPTPAAIQKVTVGSDMDIENGEFFTTGGDVDVFGDYNQGAPIGDATGPGDALFSLNFTGAHTVVGNFTVGPDTNPGERADGNYNITQRNRYFLGGKNDRKTGLFLFGNYHMEGTFDRSDDDVFFLEEQGADGHVFFVGDDQQTFWMRQDEDAFLNDVIMAGEGGILLLNDGWQNDFGTLLLELGIIDTDAKEFEWFILNPGFEPDLILRNNSARGVGVVDLGSRDSYINGEVNRVVESGNATGGLITGGYLFPVGTQGDNRDDGTGGQRDVDFFRPLILQFPDDLGRSSVSRVDYRTDLTNADLEWPAADLVVDDAGGTELTLDVVGNQFWQLEFDRIPSFDPNIRVEAASLPNITDIKRLRLIQWDCDGTNPRLAGLYDLDVDPLDDPSAVLNDFIDGIPNLTQEGVNVENCQIIGIASSSEYNRIDLPPVLSGFATLQIIHNGYGLGDLRIALGSDELFHGDYQTATSTRQVVAGERVLSIEDADNNVILEQTMLLNAHNRYNVVVQSDGVSGKVAAVSTVTKGDIRSSALNPAKAELYSIHGAANVGDIDLRLVGTDRQHLPTQVIFNNASFGTVQSYIPFEPTIQYIEMLDASATDQYLVTSLNFNELLSEAAVLLTTGALGDGLNMAYVTQQGVWSFGQLTTATEEDTELPGEFTLNGNYPNPFNPSTSIQFDLPETAEVSVQIVDMLGRNVMTIPAKMVEAGANRTIDINAISLASGTYLYRVMAQTATDTMFKTGRMTLIK